MPELPEVETVKRGLAQFIVKDIVRGVVVRNPQLRWPIPQNLADLLTHQSVLSIQRRAKYLLFEFTQGCLLAHLGMSGSMQIVPHNTALKKHDHVDILFSDFILRYHDPRRFGYLIWSDLALADLQQHPRLLNLGPEPLLPKFNATYLLNIAQTRKVAIKSLLMQQAVVVGVGNIYACEALFMAGIAPQMPAQRLSLTHAEVLVSAIKTVLTAAIKLGGTTLRDFSGTRGKPGYFQQKLNVYGRAGQACYQCGTNILSQVISGRSSFFCEHCQVV